MAKQEIVHGTGESWMPPEDVVSHMGNPLAGDLVFFVAPAEELGKLITAWTSLRENVRVASTKQAITYALMLGIGISLLLSAAIGLLNLRRNDVDLFNKLSVFAGFAIAFIAYFVFRFKHTCSFVGDKGVSQHTIKGSALGKIKSEWLFFADAADLKTSQTKNYYNGVYTGTTYSFHWLTLEGKSLLNLKGNYSSKAGTPKEKSPFYFALSAEAAWCDYLIDKLDEELQANGSIEFRVNKKDTVRIGSGFLEFAFKGDVTRVLVEDIKTLSINEGNFVIHTNEAKWLGSKGKFSFAYGQMGNAKLFLYALEQILGYQFE